jgi:hypothetical protein
MNRQLLLSEFLTTPWALMPERLQAMAGVLTRWSAGEPPTDEAMFQIQSERVLRVIPRKQMAAASAGSGIAVLPLYGVVTQRGNMVDDISGPGSTSTQQFTCGLAPGPGRRHGGPDPDRHRQPWRQRLWRGRTCLERSSRPWAQKPVVAVANSLAASAAYWIGCSASEFYVTPGGEVGSIGVWQAHFDYSKALEEEGVKTTLVSAGKFKVEGNPYVPLDPEAQAFMQSRVDDYYDAFIQGAVAVGRGVSVDDVRTAWAKAVCWALMPPWRRRMVDGIASFDDVLARMQANVTAQRRSQPVTLDASVQLTGLAGVIALGCSYSLHLSGRVRTQFVRPSAETT